MEVRRRFSCEFKLEAVRLVTEEAGDGARGGGGAGAARDLDVAERV